MYGISTVSGQAAPGARTVRAADLQPLMNRAGILHGLILALDEIGVPPVDDDRLVHAVTALIVEACNHAAQLEKEFEGLLHD